MRSSYCCFHESRACGVKTLADHSAGAVIYFVVRGKGSVIESTCGVPYTVWTENKGVATSTFLVVLHHHFTGPLPHVY